MGGAGGTGNVGGLESASACIGGSAGVIEFNAAVDTTVIPLDGCGLISSYPNWWGSNRTLFVELQATGAPAFDFTYLIQAAAGQTCESDGVEGVGTFPGEASSWSQGTDIPDVSTGCVVYFNFQYDAGGGAAPSYSFRYLNRN